VGILLPISILQLEDSLLDADLELAILQRGGQEVRSVRVERRSEFEAALDHETFDLILADFNLPDFNGLDALEIARRKAPATPFIFVSGMLGEELAIDSLRNGATDYVLKMRMERLAPAVKRAIAESREKAERKRAESALAETENRFRNMADSAPVMIWMADKDQSWNYCNRLWLEYTGLTIEESSGAGWTALVHHLDLARVLGTYREAFEARQEFSLECRLRRADGAYRWIVNRATPRFDSEGEFAGFIGSCTDITDVKDTEERLRHAAKLESLGILAGGIAHDFNNLLTGIMGNASLALDELHPDARPSRLVENILQASETAAQLTRQMLAYSGKGHFVFRNLDFSREIRDTLPLIEASVPRLVELKLDLAEELPAVMADPGQVQQVVMNLVINAAEATGPGGGTVSLSTGVEDLDANTGAVNLLSGFPLKPGRYVVLRVRDSGHGMDAETKNRIFDPFFTTKFTGRGLGLAAVSGIVRGHKGGIALTSELGRGTEFRVYFPAQHKQAAAAKKPEDGVQAGSGTVLVVEDEAVVTQAARLALEKFGYRVITAVDGKEGVDVFRSRASEIDVVLLDMTMPVMPGDIAFRKIRSIRASVPVIASSGYDEAEALMRFGEDIDSFIQKPYRAAQLAAKVEAVLTRANVADSKQLCSG
jgi:PAS domain S-box-containing protein